MRRAFRIWRCRCRCGHGNCGAWRWECTLCQPAAKGCRFGRFAWQAVVAISLPHHFRVRSQHHQYVLRHHGKVIA